MAAGERSGVADGCLHWAGPRKGSYCVIITPHTHTTPTSSSLSPGSEAVARNIILSKTVPREF